MIRVSSGASSGVQMSCDDYLAKEKAPSLLNSSKVMLGRRSVVMHLTKGEALFFLSRMLERREYGISWVPEFYL